VRFPIQSWVLRFATALLIALPTLLSLQSPAIALEVAAPPDVTAASVFAIDIDAGEELYEKDPDKQREPASTTKIATALLLVQNQEDLSQSVTIEPGDLNAEGESTMALQAGDVVTFEDLLYGLLLPSGNDAANTVARVIGGKLLADEGNEGADPVERFVQEMNNLASSLKLKNTHFLNPTGLHEDGHVTSARDMATLARRAFTNKVIKNVIKEPSYSVQYGGPNAREATIETTVTLKKEGADGVIGGKTGTTSEAGACLVLMTQETGGNRVITVLLGSEIEFDDAGNRIDDSDMRYADVSAILDQMHDDYEWVDVSTDDALPGLHEELSVWQVALQKNDSIVVPRRGDAQISYLLQLGPEAEPEAEVGRVLFFVDAEQVAERAVIQLPPGAPATT
jgi:D-alanyl-D-alanine carboxypeptidase (penicillin-binding protein 5/6)